MKILVLASDKGGRFAPFIEEQIAALQACGVQIIRYGVTGHGIMGYLRELPALRRLIRAERPDIVHAHYGLSGLLANLQRLIPVVTTYHGSDINKPNILRLSKIAMRLSAHNIFVSARNVALALGEGAPSSDLKDFKDFKDLKEGATGKHTLLPCGVNLTDDQLASRSEARAVLGLEEHAQIVLFAGAFDNAVKDAPLAQEAVMKIAPNRSNDLKDPKDLKDLKEGAPRLQELRGFSRAEVNLWMCAANCLLLTSKTEGSPQVIKEAMACGCPIVSVDVGDVAERVSGLEGCYVVRTREPKDIAVALQKALAYEGKTNGRQRILEMGLSNDQVAERLMAIYQSLG
ncbi:MAG: glycosyltransferase [Paludibacteraceae bacterium]|nr:glycosyltransferase [Paludibacteraceae bacterium]